MRYHPLRTTPSFVYFTWFWDKCLTVRMYLMLIAMLDTQISTLDRKRLFRSITVTLRDRSVTAPDPTFPLNAALAFSTLGAQWRKGSRYTCTLASCGIFWSNATLDRNRWGNPTCHQNSPFHQPCIGMTYERILQYDDAGPATPSQSSFQG